MKTAPETAPDLATEPNNRWLDILLLVLLGVALWATTCGLWDFRGPDEGRYTQVAKELVQNRNWLHLTVLGRPYDQKPPLAFCLFAAMIALKHGVPVSGMVRLPSVAAGTMILVFVYLIGRKYWGRRAGILAALMLAASPCFIDDVPTVELNILYTFWITMAMYAWLNRPAPDYMPWPRVLLFWVGVIGAFFVKGPLSFLIILSMLLWEAATNREWRNLKQLRAWLGVPVVLAAIGIWLAAEKRAFGGDFVATQVQGETVTEMLQGSHPETWWFYFPRFFTSICPPWSWLAIATFTMMWRTRKQLERPLAALTGWMLPPLIVLVLANSKRESYVLPLIPAVMLANSWFIERYLAGRTAPTWLRLICGLFGVLGALIGTGVIVVLMLHPEKFAAQRVDFTMAHKLTLAIASALFLGLGVSCLPRTRKWENEILLVSAMILLGGFLKYTVFDPALDPGKSTRELSEHLEAVLAAHGEKEIGAVGPVVEPEFHVYGNYTVYHIKAKSIDYDDPLLPSVVIASELAAGNHGKLLEAGGYKQTARLLVSKEIILVYERGRTDSGLQPTAA